MLFGMGIALALVHPRFQIATLVGDDGGYYMAIARNYVLGYGYSFDRIGITNGFNPLMPILSIGAFTAFAKNLDITACFRIATLITWLGLMLGVVPFRHFTRRVLESCGFPRLWIGLAVACATFWYAGFIGLKSYYGLDGFLVLGFGMLWLARVSAKGPLAPSSSAAIIDGALLAAVVLARLDALPLAVVAFSLMAVRVWTGDGTAGALMGRLGTFLALVAPYFIWNRVNFGEWLPISARLKTGFPHLHLAESIHAVFHTSLNKADQIIIGAALIAAIAWCSVLIPRLRRPTGSEFDKHARDAILALAAYTLLRLTWMLAFSRFDVQGSYFILAGPLVAISILVVIGSWKEPKGAAVSCGVLFGLTVLLIGGKLAVAVPQLRAVAVGQGDNGWELARRIHDAVGEKEVIYGGAEGIPGFLADRAWINGDGVANNREYQTALHNGQMDAYLKCHRVTYLAVETKQGAPLDGNFGAYERVLSGDLMYRHQTVWLLRIPSPDRTEASTLKACQSLK
jgi:hypothetical protein